MPESATNIFSMAPPLSAKGGEPTGEKSPLGGDTSSQNSSSFSSELSLAGDRQRGGLADKEVLEKKVAPAGRRAVATSAEEQSGGEDINARVVSDDRHTGLRNSAFRGANPSDEFEPGLTHTGIPSNNAASVETLSGVSEHSDLTSTKPLFQEGQVATLKSLGTTVGGNDIELAPTKIPADGTNLQERVEQTHVVDVDLPNSGQQGIDSAEKHISVPNEPTTSKADLADTVDSAAVGFATAQAVNPAVHASTSTVQNGTLPTGLVPDSSASGVLAQNVNNPLAAPPQNTVTESTDSRTNVVAIDKRLGRLSSMLEPFELRQPDNAVVLGETKNSLKVDANGVGVRNIALGLDGETALNPTLQPTGSVPTSDNGERAKGILVSDLSLPVRDTQRILAGAGIPPTAAVIDDMDAMSQISSSQIGTLQNQSTGKTGAIAASAKGVLNEVAGASGITTVDHMLAASTSGIVTAPTQGRFEPTNVQGANAPLQAPLNVPLLASSASEVLSGNIRWMVGEGIQNATVSVTPSGMGPITVQIGVEKEQMSISIVAAQASTREALEATLPRLREQLGTQGLESIRVDISDGRSDQSKNNTGSDRQSMGGNTADAQGQSAENSKNEQSSARASNGDEFDSGERVLSETERDLLASLQDMSSDPTVAQTMIRHGYDLYV